jgi:hypothetical protein
LRTTPGAERSAVGASRSTEHTVVASHGASVHAQCVNVVVHGSLRQADGDDVAVPCAKRTMQCAARRRVGASCVVQSASHTTEDAVIYEGAGDALERGASLAEDGEERVVTNAIRHGWSASGRGLCAKLFAHGVPRPGHAASSCLPCANEAVRQTWQRPPLSSRSSEHARRWGGPSATLATSSGPR